jgi:two-component system, NarL family, nitrate/nitrite response regulator NarL
MLSVLLVDDNRTFLRILTEFLAEQGAGVVRVVGSVLGGRDAVAQAETLQPDVVLVDLQMPLQSGLTLLPHLRARLPDAILVALTLLDPESYQAATLAAGADAFVSKMRLEHDLLPTIRRLVARGPRRADAGEPLGRHQAGGSARKIA